jgi:hypothetical protein
LRVNACRSNFQGSRAYGFPSAILNAAVRVSLPQRA